MASDIFIACAKAFSTAQPAGREWPSLKYIELEGLVFRCYYFPLLNEPAIRLGSDCKMESITITTLSEEEAHEAGIWRLGV